MGLKPGAGVSATVTDTRLCTLARPHLCMPSWGQDAVAALTFQTEWVPVLAQGAHLLCCGGQGATGQSQAKHKAPSFPPCSPHTVIPRDDGECLREASSIPPECCAPHRFSEKGAGTTPSPAPCVLMEPKGSHSPRLLPFLAQASPKKTGCWQRGQVQLMAPL